MKNRILVCAELYFPRGAAGSNLTLCHCKLLKQLGYEVVVIGLKSESDGEYDESTGLYCYEGIKYTTVKSGKGKLGRINNKLLSATHTIKVLDKLKADKDDIIMLYSSNGIYMKGINDYARKKEIKMFSLVVEWHQPYQYPGGKMNIRYIANKRGIHIYNPRIGNIVAISKLLDNLFKSKNCHTTIVPVIIDYERNKDKYIERKLEEGEVKNFIYAGIPFGKDDIVTMLKGIELLSKEERQKMKFYWIGKERDYIEERLGKDSYLLDSISDCLEIRGWMEYNELLKLYEKMDFLYFSKPDNTVTNALFPSKAPEAMLQGLVVVTNSAGDYPDYMIDGEDAFIFDDNTPESCCDGLRRAINVSNDKLYDMRQKSFAKAKDIFDYTHWADVMKEFLANLK